MLCSLFLNGKQICRVNPKSVEVPEDKDDKFVRDACVNAMTKVAEELQTLVNSSKEFRLKMRDQMLAKYLGRVPQSTAEGAANM